MSAKSGGANTHRCNKKFRSGNGWWGDMLHGIRSEWLVLDWNGLCSEAVDIPLSLCWCSRTVLCHRTDKDLVLKVSMEEMLTTLSVPVSLSYIISDKVSYLILWHLTLNISVLWILKVSQMHISPKIDIAEDNKCETEWLEIRNLTSFPPLDIFGQIAFVFSHLNVCTELDFSFAGREDGWPIQHPLTAWAFTV